jgi:hypothetical protein
MLARRTVFSSVSEYEPETGGERWHGCAQEAAMHRAGTSLIKRTDRWGATALHAYLALNGDGSFVRARLLIQRCETKYIIRTKCYCQAPSPEIRIP